MHAPAATAAEIADRIAAALDRIEAQRAAATDRQRRLEAAVEASVGELDTLLVAGGARG